jgi:hypothetical protein
MLIAAVCLVLILGGAFLAASLTQGKPVFSLVPPDGGAPDISAERRIDLHRTFYTAWAALILVTPALCTFLFRRTSETAARYWLAFWTASYIAFLVHFYWAVSVFFDNDWARILHNNRMRVSAPIPDTIFAVWWGLDVLLAWLVQRSEALWIRIQRALIHLAAFVLFFLGSVKEGELNGKDGKPFWSVALGLAMGVAVLVSFLIWLGDWLKKRKAGVVAAA